MPPADQSEKKRREGEKRKRGEEKKGEKGGREKEGRGRGEGKEKEGKGRAKKKVNMQGGDNGGWGDGRISIIRTLFISSQLFLIT